MKTAVSLVPDVGSRPASTLELLAVLAGMMRRRFPGARIVELQRTRASYISSWWLEELRVRLVDGSTVALMFKDLGCEAPGSGARRVKPARLADPGRESWVYRTVLDGRSLGTPELWGTVSDSTRGVHWLFLEHVNGTRLSEIGDSEVWKSVARWLGRFHTAMRTSVSGVGPLLRHDEFHHRWWFERALAGAEMAARAAPAGLAERARRDREILKGLEPMHRRAVKEALATGSTLIHGEFYPGNILVEHHTDGGPHVRPVDWETAALGPALLDLAALSAGELTAETREGLLCAYREGVLDSGGVCQEPAAFRRAVACCRLMLAIQWQGWSWGWQPPQEHRNDWLREAAACAAELET